MTPLEMLAVLGAGLGAGVLTSTVGVASLLSFPVLLAVGLPPVVANVSNTVGLVPAGVSGSFGYREELREHPRITRTVVATCALGAIGGAVLLLALPSTVFEAVVPWLILFTCLLVGVQPWIARWLRSRGGQDVGPRTRMGPVTTFFALLTGVLPGARRRRRRHRRGAAAALTGDRGRMPGGPVRSSARTSAQALVASRWRRASST